MKLNQVPPDLGSLLSTRFTEQQFEDGYKYFDDRLIFNLVKTSNAIYSLCRDYSRIYQQRSFFDDGSLDKYYCTCSIFLKEQRCKHLAALWIAWERDSKSFGRKFDFHALLASCDRQRLKDLIKDLCKADPRIKTRILKMLV